MALDLASSRARPVAYVAALTEREREVVSRAVAGLSSDRIAARLVVIARACGLPPLRPTALAAQRRGWPFGAALASPKGQR